MGIKRYGDMRELMKINTALTGEIKWGTGGESTLTMRLRSRGDTEDGGEESDEEEECNECKSKVMGEELLFVLRLLSLRKDKDVGVVSNIY